MSNLSAAHVRLVHPIGGDIQKRAVVRDRRRRIDGSKAELAEGGVPNLRAVRHIEGEYHAVAASEVSDSGFS